MNSWKNNKWMYVMLSGVLLVIIAKWVCDSREYRIADVLKSPEDKTEINEGYGATHK